MKEIDLTKLNITKEEITDIDDHFLAEVRVNEKLQNLTKEQVLAEISKVTVEEPTIKVTKHTFDELFKGKKVENPANGKYYYIIDINNGERIYVQNHKPYVQGFQPITDDDIDDIVAEHISQIKNDIINGAKLNKALQNLKTKEIQTKTK